MAQVYAAMLRLPRAVPAERRELLVEMAIDVLGLQERRHWSILGIRVHMSVVEYAASR